MIGCSGTQAEAISYDHTLHQFCNKKIHNFLVIKTKYKINKTPKKGKIKGNILYIYKITLMRILTHHFQLKPFII